MERKFYNTRGLLLLNSKWYALAVIILQSISINAQFDKINAVTFVGTPNIYSNEAMEELRESGFTHVCLVPYGFMRKDNPEIWYNLKNQWWGERDEGIIHSLKLAKKIGIKTILKPQIWMHDLWVGDLYFVDEEKRCQWESNFMAFTMHFMELAIDYEVDIFCLGTEYKILAKKNPDFWRSLISTVREKYKGKITYSSNWDEYEDISFWKDLDFIGISGYFPLRSNKNPSFEELSEAWDAKVEQLKEFSQGINRPILFTEYGYLSVDGCAGKTWELEAQIHSLSINENCQANAIKALWSSFKNQEFWAGGILWKWFPNGMGHEGYPERDYTPQGKRAEEILKILTK